MADQKGQRQRGGAGNPGRRETTSELIPAHPLSGRDAMIQLLLLIGIPLALLLLARYVLRALFPSLGY